MRLSSLALLVGASALGAAQATGADSNTDPDKNTFFDGHKVPPLLELTPDNFAKETKASKYTVVKYYSPSCPHCVDFAPTFQTLYEYYYTSEAPANSVKKTPFAKYYNMRFATVNCLAYGDMCTEHNILSYPQSHLFVNGVRTEWVKGAKNMTTIANLVETQLEKDFPGSRPTDLNLPEPGATTLPVPEKKPDTTKPYKTTPDKPAKPTKTPNPGGMSVDLHAESFGNLVTMTQEAWFIKFYAPWCHHCQAMATNWQQLAKEMKGKLNIGEVNCDANPRLCKDAGARGFPTIIFFKGGERVEYNGLRGLGDFLQYSEKALELCNGVQDVDATSLAVLEEKEDPVFVYFYDHATTSEDFAALARLPLSLIGHARLVKTNDPALYDRFKITTWPRLIVSREGRPTYYTPLTPNEMRDTHQVLSWMRSVWFPIVPELTASNAREIMDGKIVVLGVLSREDESAFQSAKREMKTAAGEWMDKQIQLFQLERQNLRDSKQLRIEEAEDRNDQRALRAAKTIRISMDKSDHKEVAFAWVDSVFWQRWLRTTYGIDTKDGDRVIINDEDARRYWDTTITGNYIIPSRTSILETIGKVTVSPPEIKPKLTISSFQKIFFDIRVTFVEHPYLSFGCLAGIAVGFFPWVRARLRRSRTSFRMEDNLPMKDLREGLLGNPANGNKVD